MHNDGQTHKIQYATPSSQCQANSVSPFLTASVDILSSNGTSSLASSLCRILFVSNKPVPDTANFTETPFYEHFKNGTTYGLTIDDIKTGSWFTNGYTLSLRHETHHPFNLIFDVLIPKSIDSNRNHLIFSDQNGGTIQLTR